MLLGFGEKCPYIDNWTVEHGDGTRSCDYCKGCRGIYANGIDCGYSVTPTSEPKFGIGQRVWYRCLPYEIRKRTWRNFNWEYIFKRERTPHDEDELFLCLRDCEIYGIKQNIKHVQRQINSFCKRYGIPWEEGKRLLIDDGKQG